MKNVATNPTEKLAPILDEVCAFKPGDLVYPRGVAEKVRLELALNPPTLTRWVASRSKGWVNPQVPWSVMEVVVQRCHGGVQIQYTCANGDGVKATFMEHALEHASALADEFRAWSEQCTLPDENEFE